MSFIGRDRGSVGLRRWLGAIAAAAGLAALLAAPALAQTGPTHLSGPVVSPRSAVEGTPIDFAITYRNHEGSGPARVVVLIDGTAYPMAPDPGPLDWKDGVRLTLRRALPVGEHAITFAAADTRKFTDELSSGSVTITPRPAPSPTPRPTATPGPTPAPTRTPTPTPAPTAAPAGGGTTGGSGGGGDTGGSGGSGDATRGSGGSGSGGAPAGGPDAGSASATGDGPATTTNEPAATGGLPLSPGARAEQMTPAEPALPADGPWAPGGSLSGERQDALSAAAAGVVAPGVGDPASASASATAGGDAGRDGPGGGWWLRPGSELAALPLPLGSSGLDTETRIALTVLETGATVGLAMAFGFFGKRRRDDEPPAADEVLAAAAASAPGFAADGGLVPARPSSGPVDQELLMPRWRRPSLLEARKADPVRNSPTVVNLTFRDEPADAGPGHERRRIRYRVVRLLDRPDELLGAEIGLLDQGDEVQLLERQGAYWLVLCPDGGTGWLHKMVLGEVVEAASAGELADGANDVDADVLQAFMSARGEPAA